MAQAQAISMASPSAALSLARPCARKQVTRVAALGSSVLGRRVQAADLRRTQLSGESLGDAVAVAVASARVTMATKVARTYICEDCGYIYKGRVPFEQLGNDYKCPVCSAPKRRFGYWTEQVKDNANDTKMRLQRKEQLKQKDAAVGSILPILLGVILLALVGVVVYFNSVY